MNECQPKDGIFEESDPECKRCEIKSRNLCKAMSIHKGYYSNIDLERYPQEVVDFILNDEELSKRVR